MPRNPEGHKERKHIFKQDWPEAEILVLTMNQRTDEAKALLEYLTPSEGRRLIEAMELIASWIEREEEAVMRETREPL